MMLYEFSTFVVRNVSRILWRVRVYGEDNVPRQGALIIACNHVSYFDPPILGAFCPRQIHYMAKQELFRIAGLGTLITALGAYPVDREGSASSAIRRSVEVLHAGDVVGIFPEGGRNPTGEAQARRGVALLASLGAAPVVPAAIVGSVNAVRFGKMKVLFGKPLHLESDRGASRKELEDFTGSVMAEIQRLKESGARS
jgi:1-acyl-sn-glycerol-3-phosphate acyltransferase